MVSINVIYGVVLAGALLHAVWNALIKGSSDTFLSATGITGAAALIAVLTLPWLTQPARASWPFMAASLGFQFAYIALLVRVYRVADMSVAYPVMRGTTPVIVTIGSVALLHEPLSLTALAGIAIICGGILFIGAAPGKDRGSGVGLRLALLNAAMIAGYTLIDGVGARRSGAPVSYTLWIFMLQGIGMLLVGLRFHAPELGSYLRTHWKPSLFGGFGSIAAYGTAVWAMTLAPVAIVAALRETSILFGVLISAFVLHEGLGKARVSGACALVLGIAVLRLA